MSDRGVDEPHTPTGELSELERAVLLTVLYSDLFEYPLSEDELLRYLVGPCPDQTALEETLRSLEGRYLSRVSGYITWQGRERIVPVREERRRRSEGRWAGATRYARWLARVPFVRAVGVCGSQAVENTLPDSDVDIFCVTETDRLWIAQSLAMALRRMARLLGLDVCPNYLVVTAGLEVEKKSLYTAREVAQLVPLWGEEVYEDFVEANRWIDRFLPNWQRAGKEERKRRLFRVERPGWTRLLERLLGGRVGLLLDHAIHRALLFYYPIRLRNRGWTRERFARFYRRDRQLVVTGGYGGSIERHFLEEARRRLGEEVPEELTRRFFPPPAAGAPDEREDAVYTRLFEERYQGRDA